MAGEAGPPKGPVPRRPPPKRPAAPPQASPAPAQGPASLPPPPDAPVESVLTPRPPLAHHDTSLFQLKEAVRVVRDPRSPQAEASAAQEPVARAGSGLGWEEPAGRPLPLPAVFGLSGVTPAAPKVRAPVAVAGAAWDRPAHPFAVAGSLSSDLDDEDASVFDEPEPVGREERVSSVRQMVLIAVSAVAFLAAGGMAVYAVFATEMLGVAEPAAEGPGSAPTASPGGALASAPTVTPPLAREIEPEPEEAARDVDPAEERARPADRPPERPASNTDDPQKPRPFEQLAAHDAEAPAAAVRAEPATKVEAEKPPPKPSAKGGSLVLHGAANAGGIKVILICPSVPDRSEVVRPGGMTTVTGVSQSCSLRLQCMASSTSVQAKYLLSKTEATCQGCNKERGDPVCQ